jgi:hypothetical protein
MNSDLAYWKNWKGRNKPCCGGRMMTGLRVDWPLLVISYGLSFIVMVFTFTFPGIYLWKTYHPLLTMSLGVVPISYFYNLFCCTFKDPGIITRGFLENPEEEQPVNSQSYL